MGSRSHYAIIRDGNIELRFSHWGAQHVESDMLWGPDVVLPYIESLDPDNREHILQDAPWSEGTAVVNVDDKTVIVSGGENIGPDPELRRLWLRLAQISWKGWKVGWAYHGISHIVDMLQGDRKRVLGKLQSTTFDGTKLYACHTQGRARMLLSIKDDKGLEHYGFDAPVEYYLVAGEQLIECLQRCRLYSVQELERGIKLPEDAIYIDNTEKRLVVTLAPVFGFYDPRIKELIESHWPGWKVDMNYEGLRQHPEAADLDFRIPESDLDSLLETIKAAVCVSPQPAPAMVGDSSGFSEAPARRHKFVPLSKDERLTRFDALVRVLKS